MQIITYYLRKKIYAFKDKTIIQGQEINDYQQTIECEQTLLKILPSEKILEGGLTS